MRFRVASLTLLPLLFWVGGLAGVLAAADPLAEQFVRPPDAAKPWCYWWWLDSNASKPGITKDLEEMKRQGISGALLFDAGEGGPDAPDGPVFMSPAWRELFKHAVREADRLGIELSVNLCSGWDSGGTWVTPEHAAKTLVWSATQVKGPGRVEQTLSMPSVRENFYRDVAVLAVAAPHGQPLPSTPARLTASSTYQNYRPELAADNDPESRWISNGSKPGEGPRPDRPEWLQLEYVQPLAAASLYLKPYPECGPKECVLECSQDGKKFVKLADFTVQPREAKTVPFAETTARFFRLVARSAYPFGGSKESWNVQISEMAVLKKGERAPNESPLKHWELKAGRKSNGSPATLYEEYPASAGEQYCRSGQVIDLTQHVDASGRLTWSAPEGAWTVLRFGYTLLGDKTKCTSPGAQGYEIDFMSTQAMDLQWAQTGAKMVADAGPLAGKTWKYVHDDSYEVQGPDGLQLNWTPAFRAEFRKRRGYDPWPYLPVLARHIIDSREVSNRFLWDVRRTIGDLYADHHYRRMREHAQRHGLGTHPESGGPFFPQIDALECEGINDIPMGEFWYPAGNHADFSTKQAACAAHTYGKPFCQAEAFTDMGPNWEESPFLLKICGDRAFCRGLGRNVLCFYVHQPYLDIKPGHQWEAAGTHFDRNITWWPQIHAWLAYLTRCQFVLRQGLFAADVCYFCGEDVPNYVLYRDQMNPPMPAGYDYDVCNAEVLLGRMSVKDGRITLPDGLSYRLLVLPQWRAMSPRILQKIKELVLAGATVVGPKPERAPGLTDYPQCDREVRKLADALWGEVDGQKVHQRKVGRGRIIWDKPLAEILAADRVPPDFETLGAAKETQLDYIHRTSPAAEIFFVANQTDRSERVACVFRVAGRQPEIWDAVTGLRRDAVEFRIADGRTAVPLEFAARQSWFIVFRKPTTALAGSGKNFPPLAALATLAGPWQVSFDPQWGGPASVQFETLVDWTKRPEPGIRYYSGKATYSKQFDLPSPQPHNAGPIYLDLGAVKNLAQVRLNGKDLGVVWTAPWRVDITEAVKPTGNTLSIDIVNLWPNRLIGDSSLPATQRRTATNVKKFTKDSPLMESGLLGPVTIQATSSNKP